MFPVNEDVRRVLHVGCGKSRKQDLIGFNTPEWEEVRLDINPHMEPDIIGTITDMGGVEAESVDAVFSSHNIEHVYPHEAPLALAEFYRVLKPDGFLVITCPDLQSTCEAALRRGFNQPLFEGGLGPITPIDVLYGHVPSIAAGQHYMAHRGGFTAPTLSGLLFGAGFKMLHGGNRPALYDLWFIATKSEAPRERLVELGGQFLPH